VDLPTTAATYSTGEVADDPEDEHIAPVGQQVSSLVERGEITSRGPAAAREPSSLVDQLAVSDREHPEAKLRLRAVERADSGEYSEEDLTGDILWFSRTLHPQIPADDGREVCVEVLERPPRANVRRVQNARKPVADGQSGPPSVARVIARGGRKDTAQIC
jgi:hypothetical protein